MKHEPPFKPKPGQIDYTHARWAPVINCIVKHGDRILVVKRSKRLRLYPGVWNGIGGFLDDAQSLEEKVKDELHEELGIADADIISITPGQIFDVDAPEHKKTWVVHPVLVEVGTENVTLDWEAEEYRWVKPEAVKALKTAPSFARVLQAALAAGKTQ